MQAQITEPSRSTPLFGEYEVVVLGGGPAGIAAALAAGRSGRSTLLIERYGFLGGAGHRRGLEHVLRLARRRARQARAGRARRRRRHPRSPARDGRLEQAAPHDPRSDPRAGLRHLGVQDRGRRAARGGQGQRFVPRVRRRRRARVRPTRSKRCSSRRSRAASRCAARSSSTARATATSPRGPACRTRSATA